MEIKAFFVGLLLVTILISSANPSLATKNYDEPLVDPDTDLSKQLASWPTSGEYNKDMLSKESVKYMEFVEYCAEKMGIKCNEEVLEGILQNKAVSKNCCKKVVELELDCHLAITDIVFKLYKLKRFAPKSLSRSYKVWNRCSAQIVSPVPFSG
ncbi:unnamed protein product [Microthlaspi erraticum]|uniref:Prolamin-like domain-containing protein n=1 Tax=Microthlaspi erraticum TaxID=1685480 RepID=A0A6D2I6A9_9BRAS|nr:unnamed protein product [Microthlaspi erraticum]